MQELNPKKVSTPFATDGTKNDIPENITDPSSNQASWRSGWHDITMVPIEAGGKPPLGQDFNGLLNQVTQHTVFLNTGGHYKFDPTFVSVIGGYPLNAVLMGDNGQSSYRSLKNNNTDNFNTNPEVVGTSWEIWAGEGKSGLPDDPVDQYVVTWDGTTGKAIWAPPQTMPVGAICSVPPNTPGWIDLALDAVHGVPVETYPKLTAAKYCGDENNATASWFYKADDAAGTTRNTAGAYFILPGLNEYFMRCGVADWILHQDQIQDHHHTTVDGYFAGDVTGPLSAPGTNRTATATTTFENVNVQDARKGDETYPKFVYENIAIKAYDIATNQTAIDIAYLVNRVQELQVEKVSLQYLDDSSIILYPNGGTPVSPANVAINQRYTLDNPYPEYYIECRAELLVSGNWEQTNPVGQAAAASASFYGISALQRPDDNSIQIQTGNAGLYYYLLGATGTGQISTPTPCRIIATRLGKMT